MTCEISSGSDTCLTCIEGYGLNEDSLCSQCPEGCMWCDFTGAAPVCTECFCDFCFNADGVEC